jgi:hypothetical protein
MATPKEAFDERLPATIVPTKTNSVSSCVHPVCPACQLGKEHAELQDTYHTQGKTPTKDLPTIRDQVEILQSR